MEKNVMIAVPIAIDNEYCSNQCRWIRYDSIGIYCNMFNHALAKLPCKDIDELKAHKCKRLSKCIKAEISESCVVCRRSTIGSTFAS